MDLTSNWVHQYCPDAVRNVEFMRGLFFIIEEAVREGNAACLDAIFARMQRQEAAVN